MKPNLAGLRRMVAGMLTDTGQVLVQTGTMTDPNTGAVVPIYEVFHDGAMLVTPTPQDARVVEAAEQAISLKTYDVWLPPDTEAPLDAKVHVTACAYDPELVYDDTEDDTRELTIIDSPADGLQVCRHVVAVDHQNT